MSHSHHCSSSLINCMDFRLQPAIREYLVERGIADNCDIISVAGAAKSIAHGESGAEDHLYQMIEVSKNLHQVTRLIIMHHMDCGAYGGHGSFSSLEDERVSQIADMHTAKEKIEKKYSGLDIELLLADIDDDGKVTIEEVE